MACTLYLIGCVRFAWCCGKLIQRPSCFPTEHSIARDTSTHSNMIIIKGSDTYDVSKDSSISCTKYIMYHFLLHVLLFLNKLFLFSSLVPIWSTHGGLGKQVFHWEKIESSLQSAWRNLWRDWTHYNKRHGQTPRLWHQTWRKLVKSMSLITNSYQSFTLLFSRVTIDFFSFFLWFQEIAQSASKVLKEAVELNKVCYWLGVMLRTVWSSHSLLTG